MISLLVACSKQPSVILPTYVFFDDTCKRPIGPFSSSVSFSDTFIQKGISYRISIFCKSFTADHALVSFWQLSSTGSILRESVQAIRLGVSYTFKLFDTIDVTVKPTM